MAKPLPSWMHDEPERVWLGDPRLPDPAADEKSERYAEQQGQRLEDTPDA